MKKQCKMSSSYKEVARKRNALMERNTCSHAIGYLQGACDYIFVQSFST